MSVARVTTVGGALLLLAGIYTLPSDLSSAFDDLVDAIEDNTVGAALVLAGTSIIIGANWTTLRYWSGFGRGNRRWVSDIELWFGEHRGFARRRKEFVRVWPGDSLLPKTGFGLALSQQTRDEAGAITERSVSFTRDPGSSFILISMSLMPSREHAELIRLGPPEHQQDLWSNLILAIAALNVQLEPQADQERLWRFKVSWAVPVDSRLTELEFVEIAQTVLRAREVVNHTVVLAANECARSIGRQVTSNQQDTLDELASSQGNVSHAEGTTAADEP